MPWCVVCVDDCANGTQTRLCRRWHWTAPVRICSLVNASLIPVGLNSDDHELTACPFSNVNRKVALCMSALGHSVTHIRNGDILQD